MKTLVRLAGPILAALALAFPLAASAASSSGADTFVMRSQTSQLNVVFHTTDANNCVNSEVTVHGDLDYQSIGIVVQSWNTCDSNRLIVETVGFASGDVQIDSALQNGHIAGTVMTGDKGGSASLPVTVDLYWSGTGGLRTVAAAPGLAPNSIGYHYTTPWFNLTSTGLLSIRTASMSGSVAVPGFTFSMESAQPEFTVLSSGSNVFVFTLKPAPVSA